MCRSGELAERIVLAGDAGEVDRHDRPRPLGDGGLDGGRVDVQRQRVHVHDDRRGAEVEDDLGRRGERVGRHDHLVAGPEADRFERKVHRGRRRVDGHGVLRADVLGELTLELLGARSGRDPAAPQRVHDLGDLVVFDARAVERQPGRADRLSAVQRQTFRDHRILLLARPAGPPVGACRAAPARAVRSSGIASSSSQSSQLRPASARASGGISVTRRASTAEARKEGGQLGGSQRTGVPPVSRHTEVVGYHEPARPKHSRHLASHRSPHRVVQDRGEDGELNDQVEARVLERQGAGVGLPDVEARLDPPSRRDPIRQQVDAGQQLRIGAPAHQPTQEAAVAAPDVQYSRVAQTGAARADRAPPARRARTAASGTGCLAETGSIVERNRTPRAAW